jgi:hypothetical protein
MTLCKAAKLPPGRVDCPTADDYGKNGLQKEVSGKENDHRTDCRRRAAEEHNPALPTPLPAPAEGIKARRQQYSFSTINTLFIPSASVPLLIYPLIKNLPIEEVR